MERLGLRSSKKIPGKLVPGEVVDLFETVTDYVLVSPAVLHRWIVFFLLLFGETLLLGLFGLQLGPACVEHIQCELCGFYIAQCELKLVGIGRYYGVFEAVS